jgi:hypothetical protein
MLPSRAIASASSVAGGGQVNRNAPPACSILNIRAMLPAKVSKATTW